MPGRPACSVVGAAILAAVLSAVSLAGSAAPAPARAASAGQVRRQIAGGERRVSRLSEAVASDTRRLDQLDGTVSTLAGRVAGLQSQLSATLSQLYSVRGQLTVAQTRLAGLQATERADQATLAAQLLGSYEGGQPDLVDVVLESTGFRQLLDGLTFVQRVGHEDTQVVARVRSDREAVATQAIWLGTLSAQRQQLATAVLADRNQVAEVRLNLVADRLAAARLRASQAGQLAGSRSQLASLTGQLDRLQAAQRAAESQPPPSAGLDESSAPAPAPGPGSGGFEFPMPSGDVSPPSTWTLDDGVAIAAPGGTPELAVCPGTIVLHGIGGFGPSAPVIHCDRPVDGHGYVYYGYAGPGDWTPVGTRVARGQRISEVGSGIVGISSGPHLEIGFAGSSGAPVGPASAPEMMSLLRAAYRG